ncbi:hypothetical protein BT96DRAFT_995136 [Gymnopus androsaceus JB14]|uniref:Protein kinase domain-containing protein n=1 Tax=Gymnopus androsaceus JB14 TaxID=1447944 RepID=A0A6A4HKV9_9AGAR|nr:hypothetical protein BT96DRAFT_995136 [Gymnopus androsaceus JB14]
MSSRILTAIDCKFSFLQLILKACITHLPDSLRRTIYDFGASLFLTLGGSQSKTHPLIHHPYVRRLPFGLVLKICSKSEGLREATALRTLEGLSRNAVNHPVFFDCVLGSLSSRDADDADNDDRTCYLIQTWIDGPRLCDVYHDYFTSDDTNRLVEDMQLQFTDLQSLTRNTNNPIICGAGGGPITDYRLPWLMEPGQ